MKRRCVIIAAATLVAGVLGWTHSARAADPADYPSRPIRLVVPFAAGSQADIVARLVGSKLENAVGQPVLIEDHPGASSNIGSEIVAKSPPDGYTLLLTGSLVTLLPTTMGPRAVDPVASFTPVTKLAEPPIVIVATPSLNVTSLAELIALARKEPKGVSYATTGVGSLQHLTALVIAKKAGVEMLHVPYTNAGQALKDVMAGEVQVYVTFLGPIDAQLRSGQLRALAVGSDHRVRAWPDIPTLQELGYREATTKPWNGVLAPAGTPPAIVDRLYREFARIVQQPDVAELFATMGMEPIAEAPELFGAEIREAVRLWPPIAREAGIRPD
jgi:tripartite-type tricarboxylate transporter receptor subunit TctC